MTASIESFPIESGAGNLPKIVLTAPDGARAELYLYGAHVTSWIPAGGSEALFLSPKADFLPGKSIRGGVPVVFPQFSGNGPLPNHGFARTSQWEVTATAADQAVLRLHESESSLKIWPHRFELEYTVRIGGNRLELSLKVSNTDNAPFDFTAALHTYLRVDDLTESSVWGLQGLRFSDAAAGNRPSVQGDEWLIFPGEVDRIYYQATSPVQLVQEHAKTSLEQTGFTDVVVWNIGPEKCAELKDMQPDGYREYVCIEAVAIEKPVVLAPGESWVGTQTLVAA